MNITDPKPFSFYKDMYARGTRQTELTQAKGNFLSETHLWT